MRHVFRPSSPLRNWSIGVHQWDPSFVVREFFTISPLAGTGLNWNLPSWALLWFAPTLESKTAESKGTAASGMQRIIAALLFGGGGRDPSGTRRLRNPADPRPHVSNRFLPRFTVSVFLSLNNGRSLFGRPCRGSFGGKKWWSTFIWTGIEQWWAWGGQTVDFCSSILWLTGSSFLHLISNR